MSARSASRRTGPRRARTTRGNGRRPSAGSRARRSRSAPPPRRRRRLIALGALVLLAAGIAIAISRLDLGEAVRELTLPLQHDDIIRQQARDKDVPADLIAAVIYAESRFRDQTSHAGARGLMQVTPDTARDIERRSGGETFEVEDLADPDINIRYGTFHLRYLLNRYGGNEVAALAAYNAGEMNADAWGGASMGQGDIRFDETQGYVREVLERRRDYRRIYSDRLGLD